MHTRCIDLFAQGFGHGLHVYRIEPHRGRAPLGHEHANSLSHHGQQGIGVDRQLLSHHLARDVACELQHLLRHLLLHVDQARIERLQHALQTLRRLLPLLGNVFIHAALPFERRLRLSLGEALCIRIVTGLLNEGLLRRFIQFCGQLRHRLRFGLRLHQVGTIDGRKLPLLEVADLLAGNEPRIRPLVRRRHHHHRLQSRSGLHRTGDAPS